MQCHRLANTPGQYVQESPATRKEKQAWERWPHRRLDQAVGTQVWNSGGRVCQAGAGVSLCIWRQTERGEGDREEGREPTVARLPKSLDFIPKKIGEPLEDSWYHWLLRKENGGKAGVATWRATLGRFLESRQVTDSALDQSSSSGGSEGSRQISNGFLIRAHKTCSWV